MCQMFQTLPATHQGRAGTVMVIIRGESILLSVLLSPVVGCVFLCIRVCVRFHACVEGSLYCQIQYKLYLYLNILDTICPKHIPLRFCFLKYVF